MSAAVDFFQWLRPGGPWVLCAIDPDPRTEEDKKVPTITAATALAVDNFVAEHDGKRNIYFEPNPTKRPMRKKLAQG